ncbi:hypothetical protein EMIT0347P_100035 [Pseudomonas sp. IT-347P]
MWRLFVRGENFGLAASEPTYSRASPLPQVLLVYTKFVYKLNHCGSGLAREEGGPFNIDVA